MRTVIHAIQVALRYDALMMWGEHGFADIGGMYGTVLSNSFRLEHGLRGLIGTTLRTKGWRSSIVQAEGDLERPSLGTISRR